MVFEHWKTQLREVGQHTYEDILPSLAEGASSVSARFLSPEELSEVYQAILHDHAELFWLSPAFSVGQRISMMGTVSVLEQKPIYSPSTVASLKGQMQRIADDLKERTTGASPERIEKEICDLILASTRYDIDPIYNQNAAAVLVDGVGQCSGISRAFKYLCDQVGLRCFLLNGQAPNPDGSGMGNHSWVMVRTDSGWHHLDPTFMLGANGHGVAPFYYVYFNQSDEQMTKHQWDRSRVPRGVEGPGAPDAVPFTVTPEGSLVVHGPVARRTEPAAPPKPRSHLKGADKMPADTPVAEAPKRHKRSDYYHTPAEPSPRPGISRPKPSISSDKSAVRAKSLFSRPDRGEAPTSTKERLKRSDYFRTSHEPTPPRVKPTLAVDKPTASALEVVDSLFLFGMLFKTALKKGESTLEFKGALASKSLDEQHEAFLGKARQILATAGSGRTVTLRHRKDHFTLTIK